MRQAIVVTTIITIALSIWLFPKQHETRLIHQGPETIHSFTVNISGEVLFPGEYQFYESITLEHVIKFAGGLRDHADLSSFNMSLTITKDRNIFIPKLGNQTTPEVEKLNINTASFNELIKIPYMSEARAAQLIIYREKVGYFNDLEDLIFVKYIGISTLEKIKPYLTI
ncbi:MAG: ComEA family DNA-binding protein [Bacillota bacterium]|nr:MAG: ComEA family DNA-binding protein [Bacillota bacterium]